MFEVRIDGNPHAMPCGTYTISRHRSIEAARRAVEAERRYRRGPGRWARGSWLPRVIVQVEAGEKWLVERVQA